MKKILPYLITVTLLLIALTGRTETTLTGSNAGKILKGAKQLIIKEESKIPSYILFEEGSQPSFRQIDEWLINNVKIDKSFGLELINSASDNLGFTHYRYLQTFKGNAIDGTMWIVHVKSGMIHSMNGFLVDNLKAVAQPLLNEQAALSKALNYINASVYKWQLSSEEALLKKIMSDNSATYFPKGKLVYSYNSRGTGLRNYRLAYRFDIYSHEPMGRKYVFIDAVSGSVADVQDRIWESNANGTAVTGYVGTQPIVTDSYNGSYRLRETNHGAGQGMETYNMLGGTDYGVAVDFTDSDNFWNNVNAAKDQFATDAHLAAEKTYDYYYSSFGRNSIDNAGLKLVSYVHYSTNYVNAFWDGVRMTYGDGNSSFNPLTSLDIGGHEITHGLTSYTADLVYANESGALNESFSDCFGTAVEWYADPSNANWLIGEDIGSPFRSHINPNAYGDPDTYQGTNWYTGTGDNGGVHTNSGVQNYWFYLLSVGGSGTNDIGNAFSVSGIGITKAAAITFRTLTVYLTSTSNYADARNYSIQSAIDLYGNCSAEMLATMNAWYAVGVGGSISTPTTLDQTGPSTFCSGDSLRLTAKANTGSTYEWYKDNSLINGASGSELYATSTGIYKVTTDLCGNFSTSNEIAVDVISLAPVVIPSGNVSSCNSVLLTAQDTYGYNVRWNKNGVPIAGATGSTYTATQSGNYSYTLQATVTPGQSLANNSIANIIDNSCNPAASSTITPAGMPALISTSGITVTINLTHTWDGDIDIMLQAPNGDVLGLSHNAGGSGQNFVNTVFSDAGAGDLTTGSAPFTGTYKPWPATFTSCMNTNKTTFSSIGNGTINPNGNWILRVYDRYSQDIGTINSWSISFPARSNPNPDCGPVTSASTSVSIGSNAVISVGPSFSTAYSLTTKTPLPATGRSFGTAASLNGMAYYGFGDNTARNDWWEFNPQTNSWTQKNNCPVSQSGGASFAIGTKIYVLGGLNGSYLNTVYQWDSGTNTWTQKGNFPGGARAYSSAHAVNGKGYLIAGADNSVTYNDIWEYDSALDTWLLKTNFGGNGRKKMTSFAVGQKIYFGLGQLCGVSCANSTDWYEYDVVNNIVTLKNSFPGLARENANGFAINSIGYVIFGNSGSTNFNDYWEYNPLIDQWNSLGNYSGSARTGSSAVTVNDKGYIFSGSTGIATSEVIEFKLISTVCTNSPGSVTLQASNGSSYLWSTGATTQSISAVATGDYSVIVTSPGCSATAYNNIAVYPVPSANITAGGPLTFCEGGTVSLTAALSNAYQWSNGETTRTISAASSGSYSVVVTGAGGCMNTSSAVNVTSRPGPPVTIASSGPTTFCQGGSVTLSSYIYKSIPFEPLAGSGTAVTLLDDQLSGSLPIGFNFTFFGNTYSNFNISSNGFISFASTGSGCCTGQLIPNPTTPNNLIAFAWTDLNPPAGGSIEYFTTGIAPNRKLIVNYNSIRHYPNVFPVTAQVILFETTNQIEIHTTSMPTDLSLHTMGLENSNGTQAVIIPGRNRASFSLTNEAVRFSTVTPTYSWSGGGAGSTLNVTTSGTYNVTVSDAFGCTSSATPVTVTVNPLPDATIAANGSTTICTGDSVTLTSSAGSSYLWSTGATTQAITTQTAGNYSVTVTSAAGCTRTSLNTAVTVNNCSVTLNIKLFIEGFFKSGGTLEATVDPVLYPALCDTIIVELHNTVSPYSTVYSVQGVINTTGNGSFIFPGGALGNSYYLAIRHRNALETWSASPVLISGTTAYDFTTAANKAFGSNMYHTHDNTWALFSGDISYSGTGVGIQDGIVESQDYADMENAVNLILTGYRTEDVTGDGIVESADYTIIENNVAQIVFVLKP